jgi:AraC-like DNA-binding protein
VNDAVYAEWAPPPALASHACCVWTNAAGSGGHVERVLPDGCADIVWIGGRLEVAGPASGPVLAAIAPGTAAVGVRFGPGAAGPALGVPARELRDRAVDLEVLWGAPAARLAERLRAAPPRRAPLLLAEAVAGRLSAAAQPDRLVAAAAGALDRGATVAAAGEAVALGERQLRRRFHDAVGYGPKTLQRVLRLRRFLALAGAGAELARAAPEAGYADQPHLTRECAELAGLPPAALLASRAAGSAAVAQAAAGSTSAAGAGRTSP